MLEAIFTKTLNSVTVSGLVQWDQGQILKIKGLNLDRVIEIHFENVKLGLALIRWGVLDENGDTVVAIPNDILCMPYDFKAWLVEIDEEERKTKKQIVFPLILRSQPADFLYVNDPSTYDALNDLTEYVNTTYEEIVRIANETSQREINFEEKMNSDYQTFTNAMNDNFEAKAEELEELIIDRTSGFSILKETDVTITPTMWAQSGSKFICKVTNSKILSDSIVNVSVNSADLQTVTSCGMSDITESFDGYFEIYAKSKPSVNFIIDYWTV